MDYEIVTKAGLTQSEFAMLCGVSRVTANLWFRGKMNPNRRIAPVVQSRLKLLNHAVEVGHLPAGMERDKEKRKVQLIHILKGTAQAMKEAAAAQTVVAE